MTPRVFYREVLVAVRQQIARQRQRVGQAWQTGLFTALASVGKLPKLAEVLAAYDPDPRATLLARFGPGRRVRLIHREMAN